MESLTLKEAVGVNSETDQAKPMKIRYLLSIGFHVLFSDGAKFG